MSKLSEGEDPAEPWPYEEFPLSLTNLHVVRAADDPPLHARPRALLLGAAARDLALSSLLESIGIVPLSLEGLADNPSAALPDVLVADGSVDVRAGALAKEARESYGLEECPLLLLAPSEVVARALDAGEDDLVLQPTDRRPLRRRIALLAQLCRARRAAALAHRALDASVNGISIADAHAPDFPLIYVSPAFERLTGYTAAEVLGRNCRFLQANRADTEPREKIRHALATGEEVRVVLQNVRKDGTPFVNELTILPVRHAGGSIAYFIGVQHDVSEMMAARAELERTRVASEARRVFMESILAGLETCIVTADASDRVTFANPAAYQLLGKTPDECLGALVGEVLETPRATSREMLSASAVRHLSYTLRRRDGTEVAIGISTNRVGKDGGPHRGGRFFIFRDLTATYQAEIERRRVDRLAALGTMVSGFAHEVRNPLAGIRLLVEALQTEIDAEDPRRDYLERMRRPLDRVERLVKTALQFGRPDPPTRTRCSASALASQAVEALLPRTAAENKSVAIEAPGPERFAFVDDAQVVQVLVILLTNALDATGSAARVRVTVALDEATPLPRVRIAVSDDGPGIPPNILQRVFDPFFTTKASGTGLGLSIAQQLVSDNGGGLEVTSVPGLTTFSILLPAVA